MFRNLKANEIECRVALIKENGAQLLLYKDARVDMNILDESGFAWQRKHYEHNGVIYCAVGLYQPAIYGHADTYTWQWREDAGAESYTEKEKGAASDAFKRACVNWGIGRELYTSPFIWVPADKCRIEPYNGKLRCRDSFRVHTFEVVDGEIVKLAIYNTRDNAIVYKFGI